MNHKVPCNKCHDYGRHQIYRWGRVMQVYCQCPVGRAKIEKIREMLRDMGLDPYDKQYSINQEPNI